MSNQNIKESQIDLKKVLNEVENNKLSLDFQSQLLDILQREFKEEEQSWFITNFFVYLNYHPTDEYPINLGNIFKLIGFAHKKNAKRTLENNFVEGEDYKVVLLPREQNSDGGRPEEEILMNVDTFKNLCLITKTEKSKRIRKYYIKLEQIFNKLVDQQRQEYETQLIHLKNNIQQKDQLLQEKEKTIQILENKPETEGFNEKPGYIYLIKDTATSGSYKIGLGEHPDRRLVCLNISSSQKSLKLLNMFYTKNMKWAEKMIHILLEPFKIRKRNEWFYFSNNTEVNYVIHIIKTIILQIDQFSFGDYLSFKNYAENLDENEIKEEDILFHTTPRKVKVTNTNFLAKADKVSKYNGVTWSPRTEKWTARLTKDNNTIFLGDYSTEFDAGTVFNDYASYLNRTKGTNYQLNDIQDYTPNPRDVPEDKYQNKSSKYTGVYFIKSKQIFEASIRYKKKSHKLIKSLDDLECAKVYNEQCLYFNNHLGTNYKLNDIPDFETVEKNHIHDLECAKVKKFSRFVGVSIRNDCNKFRAYIKHNRKTITCGTFKTEEEAARAYNKKAEELNQLETTKIKYELNVIDE
jgi:phage anti-repressor protein